MNVDLSYDLLKRINVKNLNCYLKLNGWKKDLSYTNEKNILFIKLLEDSDDAEIVIPAKEYYKDFIPRIKDVIEAISIYDNKSIQDVYNEIVTQDIDRMEFRIISDMSSKGSLPLNYASDVVNGLKELIVSSACNEENPRPVYNRITLSAKRYADLFKFGQTAYGSFIMTIESDELNETFPQMAITNDCEIITSKIDVPFQRKILRRVQKALYQIENIGSQGNLDFFIENAFEDGINANMCDAILNMKNVSHSVTIESNFNWAGLYPEDNDLPNKLYLTNTAFPFIQAIRDAYKDKQLLKELKVTGNVKQIKIDSFKYVEANELGSGYITLEFAYENRPRTVKVYLEGEPFQLACDALRDMKVVSVFGILDMSTKFWHLDNPIDFKIV